MGGARKMHGRCLKVHARIRAIKDLPGKPVTPYGSSALGKITWECIPIGCLEVCVIEMPGDHLPLLVSHTMACWLRQRLRRGDGGGVEAGGEGRAFVQVAQKRGHTRQKADVAF